MIAKLVVAAAVIGSSLTGGSAAADTTTCTTTRLSGRIVFQGAAAGNRYALLEVTNQGDTCTLSGYSGLRLATADGTELPTLANPREVEGGPADPAVVELRPAGGAVANLHWIVGPCFIAGDDGTPATRPATVTVTPPGETAGFALPWTYGAVCGEIDGPARIDISAYRAA